VQKSDLILNQFAINAPPAFAQTTMFTQEIAIKRLLSPPTFITTVHFKRAVVKLSAIGEIKNAKHPVNQKIDLSVKCIEKPTLLHGVNIGHRH